MQVNGKHVVFNSKPMLGRIGSKLIKVICRV